MNSNSNSNSNSNNRTRRKHASVIQVAAAALLALSLSPFTAHADVTYIHTDHLGNPAVYTNGKGEVIKREFYMPYGESLMMPGGQDGPDFTGHVRDSSTGLVYMQARYYDPEIGRFLSVDPVTFSADKTDHFNRYWYANGNPVRYTDPDGRCANLCTAAVGAVIGGLVGLAAESYSQIKAGEFDGRSLLVETGKGAVVGGLIGLTGGAAAASSMSLGAQAATTGAVGFGVGAGTHSVGEIAKGNAAPSAGESMKVGAATALGAVAGTLISPVTATLTTTVTPAVSSHPVTSLSGKVFNTVNIPAQTVTRPVTTEVMNNAASATVEEPAKALLSPNP